MGALRSGAYAFIPKSFRPEELISTVEQALTKVRLAREREELERRYRALVELTDVLVVGLDVAGSRRALQPQGGALRRGRAGRGARVVRSPSGGCPGRTGRGCARPSPRREWAGRRRSRRGSSMPSRRAAVGRSSRRASCGTPRRGRRVRWHLSMARGGGDEAALVYGFGIDVTERRALEKRAADAEALSAMGTLALNLAHEVRNPLNAAVLQLHLLGRHVDKLAIDDEARAALRHKASDRRRRDRAAQPAAHGVPRAGAPAGPRPGARPLRQARRGRARPRAGLRGRAPGRRRAGARERLRARRRPREAQAGRLEPGRERPRGDEGGRNARGRHRASNGDEARLVVDDTGAGIDAASLAQVFDPFFTTKEAGTGLGLSIVRKIVDQHRGEVRIESEQGVGTRVTVVLPRGR